MTSELEIDTEGTLNEIANFIESKCGKGYGFAVMVFPFGGDGRTVDYISNTQRESMISMLREKADILEANKVIETKGVVQ